MKKYLALAVGMFVMLISSQVLALPILTINCTIPNSCSVYVNGSYAGVEDGSITKPYNTITEAVTKVQTMEDYNNIKIAKGTYGSETLPWSFNNPGKNIYIYGGYSSDFSVVDATANPVHIDANSASGVLNYTSVGGSLTGVDIYDVDGGGGDQAVSVSNTGATSYTFTISNNKFRDNNDVSTVLSMTATGSNKLILDNNTLYQNQVSASGGVISLLASGDVKNNRIYSNTANSGVMCLDAMVYNNFISGNTFGGLNSAAFSGNGNCTFIGNTVTNNDILGSLVYLKNGNNDVMSNLFAGNLNIGGDIDHEGADASPVDYNAFFDNSTDPAMSDNNLTCDPMLGGVTSNDPNQLKLGSTSTCIDKGMNSSDVAVDYFGTIRPVDGDGDTTVTSDPGAYEAPAAAVTAPTISGLALTLDSFSPDADGVEDSTTASFTLNTNATVTVAVKDVGGTTTYKVLKNAEAMPAGTVSTVWDGKETGGAVLSEGDYMIDVTVTNPGGSDNKNVTAMIDVSDEPTETQETEEPGTQCAGFTDVAANHSDCDAIEYVKSIGAMTGNPDGTFKPNEALQRDQVAKISLETFDLYMDGSDYCGGTNPFPDVTNSDWSFQYVCRGVDLDMITGYLSGADAGFYRPSRSVNRVEFLALILRNLSDAMPGTNSTSYSDVPSGQWFSGYAKYSYDHSLFTGTNLNPTQFTTRAEVAQVIFKLHEQGEL